MVIEQVLPRRGRAFFLFAGIAFASLISVAAPAEGRVPTHSSTAAADVVRPFVDRHCIECHDGDVSKGDLNLEAIRSQDPSVHSGIWERVVQRLRTRQMPPSDKERPEEAAYTRVLTDLERSLDAAAVRDPDPGRTPTLRRLNRTEYQNAIRDLLDLQIDAAALLPSEDAGHGFDNVAVGTLSPTLLDRYLSAAQKISRLAVGTPQPVAGHTFRLPPDLTQEEHVEGLPLGTRGGTLIPHVFPLDAEYEIQIRLTRDRNEEVEGLREPHGVEVLLDRKPIASFVVVPPGGDRDFEAVDRHLRIRVPITAGPHAIGVTFPKKPSSLLETRRQPGAARFNMHRHPRLGPAVYQVTINGPYEAKGPGETPSRRRIFGSKPTGPADEDDCARRNLTALARRAYHRPVTGEDLEGPMRLYREAREEKGFEAGIEAGLGAILVSPGFLLRIERDPEGIPPRTAYRITDLELASRLSFFLWSSIPDEELLGLAVRGELHRPAVLEEQTRRMLADPRAAALSDHFAGQWLYLRNLESFTPDVRLFPDFDDNLRQSLRRETELFFQSVLLEDRSVLDLVRADHTFLNERLARHYGVAHVRGSQFRKVAVADVGRGGLLRHGSILAVTSYADRTSPVMRGKWVLENLLGTPPPPPPPNVSNLEENRVSSKLSVRERLALHRADPACAGCHKLLDPPGFALENFDAVGRWRTLEEGRPVDATGGLPDGSRFEGVTGLEESLLHRPEVIVGTIAGKLLTYALGRGLEPHDAPAVRKILRDSQARDYRFSSIIVGITQSTPFTFRRSE
jgi:hypothetical protein